MLRARMSEDGFLFLLNYLERAEVLAARRTISQRLHEAGLIDRDFPIEEA